MSSPLSSPVDYSPKIPLQVKTDKTHAHIPRELNMQAQ